MLAEWVKPVATPVLPPLGEIPAPPNSPSMPGLFILYVSAE